MLDINQNLLNIKRAPINVINERTHKSHIFSMKVTPEYLMSAFLLSVNTVALTRSPVFPGRREFRE